MRITHTINQFMLFAIFALLISPVMSQESQKNSEESQPQSNWETHVGIGLGIGANGLPSQISNSLAQKEGFISKVGSMKGLPLGVNIMGGFGYRFKGTNHSLGFEFSLGFNNDGGSARVTLGDNPSDIPGYVFDGTAASVDPIGIPGGAVGTMFVPGILAIYPGLSTINTMKGQYLDPKFRVYYRYRKPTWNIQTGLGLGFMIPLNYFAYPSKKKSDYILADRPDIQGLFDAGWTMPYTQGAITSTRIPFPLKMRDGTVMMRAFQPLLDIHIRASYRNYYLDLTYATEFRYIHHLKIGLGVQFM
ncbi:hypothetical protein PVA45_03710 [Entomospira entomophila]|uniref:Uncharacterized protein n=1 Tax=Entomospira entomophila TaxID=2719988 RepID=A0A968KRD1_9SPIO|nr:hypothetical protein [Entomospira entomophilus]NIZ40618.1 hypothetical protein [Entomospira entomophilus]WDI34833.1 hypothetical protein PVA45_03710 [Entomospira entomophilus]